VLVTIFTTLAHGEHYFVDLVVAVPFALAIQAAWTQRWNTMAVGFGLVAGWFLLLRYGVHAIIKPALPGTLVMVTLLVCGYLTSQLMRSTGAEPKSREMANLSAFAP